METNYLEHSDEYVNKNLENEILLEKLKRDLSKRYSEYKSIMRNLAGDAPIQVLCLDKKTEGILLKNGHHRIHNLFDLDFTKIKGLGVIRTRNLAACLDQFLSVM